MTQISKRAFDRNEEKAAITFAYCNGDAYYPGRMTNNGEGGMKFETEADMKPGDDIVIKVTNGHEKKPGAVVDDVFRGRIVWRRKTDEAAASVCHVGVKYVENVCHSCGRKVRYLDIIIKEDHTILCRDCFAFLEDMGDGKLKECLENYLLGNVI